MMGVISSSSESLPEGTVVIELPRLALLDVDLLGSMPEYTAIASSTPNCTLSKGFTRSQRNLKLLVMLAIEKLKGSTSEFSPYLELLPSQAELRGSDLYYAGDDLVKDFGSLPIMSFWRRIQAEHYKEFEYCFYAMKAELPHETSGVSWEDVEALLRMHRSRHFAITEPWSLEFLSPAADYVNTGITSEQNVKVVLMVGDQLGQNLTLQFVVSHALDPGQELISSYFTGLDNEDVLFRWNMYLEDNEIGLAAGEAVAICTDERHDLRAATLKQLDLEEQRPVPRCLHSGIIEGQVLLRCSLARLAYELCAASWFPEAVAGRTVVEVSPSKGERIAGYLILYSMILRNRGDKAGAKHALNELFARAERGLVAESLVDALLQMAGWLVEEEDLEEAEKHVLQAMRLSDDPRAYFKHGTIRLASGDRLSAHQSFRGCLERSEPGTLLHKECGDMGVGTLRALGLQRAGPGATRSSHPTYSNQSVFLKKLL